MKKGFVFIIIVAIIGLVVARFASAQTTTEFSVEADTEALWHMDGAVASAGKIDNAEGTVTWDLDEDGTINSSTGWNAESDGAYSLPGTPTNNFHGGDLDLASGSWTIEGWILFTTLSGTPTIFSKDQGGNTNAGDIRITYNQDVAGKLSALIQADSTNTTVDSGTFSFATDTWYYIAVTNDATYLTLYIDGTQVDQDTRALPINNTNTWTFGCDSANDANNCFNGKYDEFRISSTAHSGETISAYYESGVEPPATATTTATSSIAVYNESETVYNGFVLFFIAFFGILFYFRKGVR